MNLTRLSSALVLLALGAFGGVANAQVQKCTDANGKVTYSDVSCPHNAPKKKSLGISSVAAYSDPVPQKSTNGNGNGSLSSANDAFNQRHAARQHNEAVENANNATLQVLKTPPPPGVTRTVTLVRPN